MNASQAGFDRVGPQKAKHFGHSLQNSLRERCSPVFRQIFPHIGTCLAPCLAWLLPKVDLLNLNRFNRRQFDRGRPQRCGRPASWFDAAGEFQSTPAGEARPAPIAYLARDDRSGPAPRRRHDRRADLRSARRRTSEPDAGRFCRNAHRSADRATRQAAGADAPARDASVVNALPVAAADLALAGKARTEAASPQTLRS